MSTVNDDAVDNDDEYVWTTAPFAKSNPLHKGLYDLESALRCGICCAWYTAPVSIAGCHHTFCSECIRNRIRTGIMNMKRNPACPVCREPIICRGGDYQLVPNRSMEELVTKFTDIKQSLRTALADTLTSSLQSNLAAGETPGRGDSAAAAGEASAEILSQASMSSQDQGVGRNLAGLPRRSPRSASQKGTSVHCDEKENADPAHNVHDEDCEIVMEEKKAPPRLQKMAKTIYHGLKKKQLQEKCHQCGLSTRGNDKELKERHQEYVTLYNSECDSFQPRSKEALLRLIQEREKARKDVVTREMFNGAADHTTHMKRLMESRKIIGNDDAATAKLSSGSAAFDKKVQSNFAKLIEQAKRRKQQLKAAAAAGGTSRANRDNKVAQLDSSDDPSPMSENDEATGIDVEAKVTAKEAASSLSNSTTSAVDGEELSLAEETKVPISSDTNASAVARFPSSASKGSDCKSKKMIATLPKIPPHTKSFGEKDMKLPLGMFQRSNASASFEIVVLDDDAEVTDKSSCKSPPVSSAATSPPLSASSCSSNSATEIRKREAVLLSPGVGIGGNKRSKRVPSSPWNCPLCTFYNTKRSGPNSRCEVCDTPRSVATATCYDTLD